MITVSRHSRKQMKKTVSGLFSLASVCQGEGRLTRDSENVDHLENWALRSAKAQKALDTRFSEENKKKGAGQRERRQVHWGDAIDKI